MPWVQQQEPGHSAAGVAVSELVPVLLAELRADPAALEELRELLAAGPSVYTPATLAGVLGRTPRAIRAAIQRGELDAVKRGNGWVIAADAVERWAAGAPRTSGPKLRRRGRGHRDGGRWEGRSGRSDPGRMLLGLRQRTKMARRRRHAPGPAHRG